MHTACSEKLWEKSVGKMPKEPNKTHTRLHARQTIVMENPMVKPNFSFFANLI